MNSSDSNPFLLTFWYKPARSMRRLLDLNRGRFWALLIAAFFGMILASRVVPSKSEALVWYFTVCGFLGIACLFLFGWSICNFGRWFGIEAIQGEVRTALALGLLPWTITFAILSLILYSGVSPASILTDYFSIFIGTFIYGFYILLFSLKAALRVGLIATLLCLVVTTALSFFPLVLLAQFLASYLN